MHLDDTGRLTVNLNRRLYHTEARNNWVYMRQKKRFIAGAVCPQCKQQDTLMLYFEHGVEHVECVECGHEQSQTSSEVSKASGDSNQVIGLFKPE